MLMQARAIQAQPLDRGPAFARQAKAKLEAATLIGDLEAILLPDVD